MDYQLLLLAAEVRKLAAEYRNAQRETDLRPYAQAEEATRRNFSEAWESEFPLSAFIPRAHREIADVARQISPLVGE